MNARMINPVDCATVRDVLARAGTSAPMSVDEIERAEAHLNACSACGQTLEATLDAPDELARLSAAPALPAEVWAGLWGRVERGLSETAAPALSETPVTLPMPPGAQRRGRTWRVWSTLAAAACLLAVVGLWRAGSGGGRDQAFAAMPLQSAQTLEIDELEVGDLATPFVLSTGDNGVAVIWVVEDAVIETASDQPSEPS